MTVVIGVGGPKGGVGKTTLALNMATHCVRGLGEQTLLVDTDPNRSALDAATAAGAAMPFQVAASTDPAELEDLRTAGFDVVLVDLPGVREHSALDALLREGALDVLAFPTRPELMDLRPLLSFVDERVRPNNVPYLIALTRVHRDRCRAAEERREELRSLGYRVASTYTRALVSHDDALELAKPVCDLPGGRHSTASAATREYRALVAELLAMCGHRYDPDHTTAPVSRIPARPTGAAEVIHGNSTYAC
ncbi:ParA family protein [Sciscionella sediminilitoris]|uniref:ParA family protein n=1 Tax=Sciscionella sediminilitoris TaxID=1445613 RepID=UPI0018D01D37|nr:ParA family protein [Sciscionella sp. SE31]